MDTGASPYKQQQEEENMNGLLSNPWVKLAAVVGGAYLLYTKVSNPLVKGLGEEDHATELDAIVTLKDGIVEWREVNSSDSIKKLDMGLRERVWVNFMLFRASGALT
ncbi:MAG: hypothetical protein HZC43_11290 [Nitrosomonadales bacterium]|nr:hypothetical protein [Nitrosomonadales bacterium]